jgi:acyl-CoA thioester hydrolase
VNRPKPGQDTSTELAGHLIEGGHSMHVRIYYEDTDFSGIVYHANYLRFMERGRTNYLRLVGADHRALFEQTEKEAPSFAFVVRSMKIDFLRPAFMDDLLEVRSLSKEVSGASITLFQQVMRGEEVIMEAEVRVAFVSEGKPRRIPEPLRKAMGEDAEHYSG